MIKSNKTVEVGDIFVLHETFAYPEAFAFQVRQKLGEKTVVLEQVRMEPDYRYTVDRDSLKDYECWYHRPAPDMFGGKYHFTFDKYGQRRCIVFNELGEQPYVRIGTGNGEWARLWDGFRSYWCSKS